MHGANGPFPLPHPTSKRRARHASLIGLSLLAGCSGAVAQPPGDPAQGKLVISRNACGSCHRIAGIPEADGSVGPPLSHFGSQKMIAGLLPNAPDTLQRYLKSPQTVVKGNVMPDQHLTDAEARDAAAYLLTLR